MNCRWRFIESIASLENTRRLPVDSKFDGSLDHVPEGVVPRVPMPSGFETRAGVSARATIEGREVQVGGPRILTDAGVELSGPIRSQSDAWAAEGAIFEVG